MINSCGFEQEDLFSIEHIKREKSFDMKVNHTHNVFEIYYLLTGERYYFIEDRTYHVKKGDLVLIDKNILHKTSNVNSKSHERILLSFEHNFLSEMISNIDDINLYYSLRQKKRIYSLNIEEQHCLENLLFKIIAENKKKDLDYKTYLQVLLIEFLIFCTRIAQSKQIKEDIKYPNSTHKKVAGIANYINNNYQKELSLKQVAQEFYLTPSYLSKIFKQVTGFTFVEYRNNVRVKEAKRLLKQSDLNIAEIALQVGYNNITHFGRVFKQIVGISPLQYRKI